MASSMALRRATTTTTASTLFTKFLYPKAPFTAVTLSAVRSFASTATTTPPTASTSSGKEKYGSDDTPIIVQGSPQKFKMENPFQSAGPRNVIEVDEVKNGTLVRVALPGVGVDGFRVWAENNTVFFAGKGEIECETDDCERMYGGSLEFRPELHRADGVEAEMKNGVLRLLVPNAEGAEQQKEGK